jgi:hypothetical protein
MVQILLHTKISSDIFHNKIGFFPYAQLRESYAVFLGFIYDIITWLDVNYK